VAHGEPAEIEALVLRTKRQRVIASSLAVFVALAAWVAYAGITEHRIARLTNSLDSADAAVRNEATGNLGAWKSKRVIDALIVVLNDEHRSDRARDGARDALIAIGPSVVEPLIIATERRGPTFPSWLPQWLRQALGEVPVRSMRREGLEKRGFYQEVLLQRIGPAAADPLIRLLGHARSEVRTRAAWELSLSKPPRAIAPLISLLKDRDARVRRAGVRALSAYRDACVVAPIMSALKDPDDLVAWQAAETLGRLRDPAAIRPLIDAVENRKIACTYAIGSLGELAYDLGSEEAIQALLRYLKSPDLYKRQAAACAIWGIRDARVLEPLVALLCDPDTGVSAPAACALGRLGDDRAAGPLAAVLDKEDAARELKVKALLALSMIGGPEADAAALKFVASGGEWAVTWEYGENVPDYIMYGGGRDILIAALNKAGDVEMANRLYWSGDADLADAAAKWGSEHDCLNDVTLLRERHEYAKWGKLRQPRP
jgi:HEAT repeat protein